jgi:hypothetical protein
MTEVDASQFVKPSGFIFLHERNVFLTLRQGHISVWDLAGKLITQYAHPPSSGLRVEVRLSNRALRVALTGSKITSSGDTT